MALELQRKGRVITFSSVVESFFRGSCAYLSLQGKIQEEQEDKSSLFSESKIILTGAKAIDSCKEILRNSLI